MTRHAHHHFPSSFAELTATLSECNASCDPDFDFWHEELERQFAELRLQHAHE
jgi:hypothetical protein